jgi:hypothetical protein
MFCCVDEVADADAAEFTVVLFSVNIPINAKDRKIQNNLTIMSFLLLGYKKSY